jgi:hypothetical protein
VCPGHAALTLMFVSASSRANATVTALSALFEGPYATSSRWRKPALSRPRRR